MLQAYFFTGGQEAGEYESSVDKPVSVTIPLKKKKIQSVYCWNRNDLWHKYISQLCKKDSGVRMKSSGFLRRSRTNQPDQSDAARGLHTVSEPFQPTRAQDSDRKRRCRLCVYISDAWCSNEFRLMSNFYLKKLFMLSSLSCCCCGRSPTRKF